MVGKYYMLYVLKYKSVNGAERKIQEKFIPVAVKNIGSIWITNNNALFS